MSEGAIASRTTGHSLHHPSPRRVRSGSKFFRYLSTLLLVVVIIGFARTFFLRAWFEVRPIPDYLFLHGIVLTAWFIAVTAQSWLIATRRVQVHRRIGWIGTGIAIIVVLTSSATVAAFPGRQLAMGFDLNADMARIARIVWVDIAALLAFVWLITVAVALRRRPDIHKRAMLLGSISIIQPALGRMFRLPMFEAFDDRWLSWGGLVALVTAVVAYDVFALRRLHKVTALGGGLFLASWTAFAIVLPGTEVGKSLVRWLATL